MTLGAGGRRPWPRRLVLVAVVAVLLLDGLAIVFRTRSTTLSVGQAVANYRNTLGHRPAPVQPAAGPGSAPGAAPSTVPGAPETPMSVGSPGRAQPGSAGAYAVAGPTPARPATTAPSPMPADGVYVYATSGYEKLSTPGAQRQYPSRSTITVSPQGSSCQSQRWEPAQEHWEDYVLCFPAPGEVTYQSTNSYVSFYGVGEQASMTCTQPAWWRPPTNAAGAKWTYVCSGSGARYVSTGTVIGIESVLVGAQAVPAVHLHVATTFSGSEQGSGPEDVWLALSNSLILRMVGSVDANQNAGPFGHVQYHEDFNLTLTSTTPQQ
jgi:hypothetical protein